MTEYISPGRCGMRSRQYARPGVASGVQHYLEIFGTISIGADDQRRPILELGMVFHLVLDAALARRQ